MLDRQLAVSSPAAYFLRFPPGAKALASDRGLSSKGFCSLRYLFEDYALDPDRRELYRGANVVPVAPQVFDLLDYLIRNRKRVVSKDDLINAIWNGRIVSDAALTTRLNAARSAIGDSGEEQRFIKTLPRRASVSSGLCGKKGVRAPLSPTEVEPEKLTLALPNQTLNCSAAVREHVR